MLAGSATHFGSMSTPAFSVHHAREPPMVSDSVVLALLLVCVNNLYSCISAVSFACEK